MSDLPDEAANADILIVDDTPANLRLLTGMLGQQGYKVRPVPNGRLAPKAIESTLLDLILLDVKMPELNGYQVCQHLKADERTRDIPVIFISALHELGDKVKAFEVGGVDCVTYPWLATGGHAEPGRRDIRRFLRRPSLAERAIRDAHSGRCWQRGRGSKGVFWRGSAAGRGCGLIDPHSLLVDDLLRLLVTRGVLANPDI